MQILVVIRQMVKPMLVLAGRVLFKANCQEGPINPHRVRDAKFKEHNTGMTESKAARVEQNTEQKAKPSTLYQVYRCIKLSKRYCDNPTHPCSNTEQTATVPATSNAIRGAE